MVCDVPKMIPSQVQPGARSELEEPERELTPLDDVEKSTHESCSTRHFVRLHRVSDSDAKLILVIVHSPREVSPQALRRRIASDGRVVGGECLGSAIENDPMDGGHEPQPQGRGVGISVSSAKDLPNDASSFGVARGPGEQAGVQRGSEGAALVRLPSKLPRDPQSRPRVAHAQPYRWDGPRGEAAEPSHVATRERAHSLRA